MPTNLLAQHVEPPPARILPPDSEAPRLLGAVALLFAAAMVLTGGLLWRERARAQAHGEAQPPAALQQQRLTVR